MIFMSRMRSLQGMRAGAKVAGILGMAWQSRHILAILVFLDDRSRKKCRRRRIVSGEV